MTPADQLARIEADTAALREAIERIKNDPILCSRFLGACARLQGLEREVRSAALAFLEAGQPVPGVELNEGRLSSVVTAETILELIRDPEPRGQLAKLTAFVEAVCPIRESVYFVLCRKLGIKPRNAHVQRSRGQPFVIFKGASRAVGGIHGGKPMSKRDETVGQLPSMPVAQRATLYLDRVDPSINGRRIDRSHTGGRVEDQSSTAAHPIGRRRS